MSVDFDPYLMLGVPREASTNDVKAAYRRVARRLHPDKNQHNPGAGVQFQDITSAYELLLDDEKRRQHLAQQKQGAQTEGRSYTFRVTPSKRSVSSLSEVQVMYLLAEIIPDAKPEQQQTQRESRLNLTLVLDQSNSMSGKRIDQVRIAANKIIDQLTPEDILSVVAFNDFAEIIIQATTVSDKSALKAKIALMSAGGGTEMLRGLAMGIEQNKKYLAPRLVNHIILVTDGNTYGDEAESLKLVKLAAEQGISISAMGLGEEWNDTFLDEIASVTGGTSQYIQTSGAVVRFLNDHVRSLSNVFAERMQISIAPDPDIRLEYAFRIAPNPQPLSLKDGFMQLGGLQIGRTMVVLFQIELPPAMASGFRSVARLAATGDILGGRLQKHYTVSDLSVEVTDSPPAQEPPTIIMEALNKLALYQMQERANTALASGDTEAATHHLNRLSTRLLALGEPELAKTVQEETHKVRTTQMFSPEGQKLMKYQTRFLLGAAEPEEGNS